MTHRTTAIRHQTTGSHRGKRAYILLVVLAFTTLATSLGMAFLEANSTVMPEAVNYHGSVRAEALASSGVAMASHFLLYPPTTINLNGYYTGASGVTLDSSGDYYDVSVVRSDGWSPAKTDLNLYRVTAMGVAKDPGGAIRAKRSITAEVQSPPIGKWQFTQAFLCSAGSLSVNNRVTVVGDLHANGNITGGGNSCNGKVTATGLVLWTGGGPTSVTSFVANLARPFRTPYQQSTYTIRGKTYTPYSYWWSDEIDQSDANWLNAIDMSSTNPGRVILARGGNFKIRQDVQLNGTLVVDGDLRIEESGSHQITAEPGFPALVVVGDVKVRDDNSTVTVNGSVISTGKLDSENHNSVNVTVQGTFFADAGMDAPKATCSYRFEWDAARSVFWDIQNVPPAPQAMTILNWKEN